MEGTGAETERKAGAPARIGAAIGALVLGFVAAVVIAVMVTLTDTATCEDVLAGTAERNDDGECYDGSSTVKAISLTLGGLGGVAAAVAALLAIAFAFRGRGGRRLIQVTIVAAVLVALSLIIG